MKYIQFFKDIGIKNSKEFGGKVASLGEMYSAGIPVPNGFGISIEAHREFASKPFSMEFKVELCNAFLKLRAKRVAVRSSAVAEDAADASWAGQLETYLNINGDGLESAVRKCWVSVEASHVKNYAKDKNVSKEDMLVGVAVQSMVDSEVAGVMFTINPTTKNKNEIMIEGAYGLGEMVVQGIVNPDNYLVDNKSLQVSHFGINIKERMMAFQNGKNVIVKVPEDKSDRAVLREPQVISLAKLGKMIEKHYGKPQDIEWAYKDKKFYIVQSRPITTL